MHIRTVTQVRPAPASDVIIILDVVAQILNIIGQVLNTVTLGLNTADGIIGTVVGLFKKPQQ